MAYYRNISIYFWTDSKVDDEFTPEDKYFYLYLLTNPHTNICGCYEVSMKQMERETGYNTDSVKRLIARMQETHKVIKYDENTKEVFIINWHKYNWSKSEKVKKAVLAVADHIRSDILKKYVMDTISIHFPCDIDTTVTTEAEPVTSNTDNSTTENSNTENRECVCADKPRRTHASKFIPPTVEEVRAYCKERGNQIDAERFVAYHAEKGWKIRGTPITDWKAAIVKWEQVEKQQRMADKTNQPRDSSFDISDFDKLVNRF